MEIDNFGFLLKYPPYKVSGPSSIERIEENWERYEVGDGFDKYFIYWRCNKNEGKVFYAREVKEEYKDIITEYMEHLPLEELETLLWK